MTLSDYLARQDIRPTDFARLLGVPSSTISRLLKGERGASLGLALRIEKQTDGLVTPSDLGKKAKPTDNDSRADRSSTTEAA